MYFQISEVIVWPRRTDRTPRRVKFESGGVNVISGVSKTGKSAIIPIIDYCLGSDKCAIPSGVIRERSSWFGVVVDTAQGKFLLSRREPGDQFSTDDMHFRPVQNEGEDYLEHPDKSYNRAAMVEMLNDWSGLTRFSFDPTTKSGFKSRASFRDLMAFCFQPQNIIANQAVLFYKADSYEHREKLKTIFSYAIGALTPELIADKWRLEELEKQLRKKQLEHAAVTRSLESRKNELQSLFFRAIELGLLPPNTTLPSQFNRLVDLLSRLGKISALDAVASDASLSKIAEQIRVLEAKETEVAARLNKLNRRRNDMKRLQDSVNTADRALGVQRDRLSLASWVAEQANTEAECPVCHGPMHEITGELKRLTSALGAIELALDEHDRSSPVFDKELFDVSTQISDASEELRNVRDLMKRLDSDHREAREARYKVQNIDRFLGSLDSTLNALGKDTEEAKLASEIRELERDIGRLRTKVSDDAIDRLTQEKLRPINGDITALIADTDAEWKTAPVELALKDLTIKIDRGRRKDALWELGSGANWLAYHVATSLALQKHFLREDEGNLQSPVPGFLILDQPSQVYFPRRLSDEETIEDNLKDKDKQAVRGLFTLLDREVGAAKGRLQVIVLEHVADNVWGDLPHTHGVEERWEHLKLIPDDWAV